MERSLNNTTEVFDGVRYWRANPGWGQPRRVRDIYSFCFGIRKKKTQSCIFF